MTKFETDGFLSAEIAEYERDVETFYPKRLEIAQHESTCRPVGSAVFAATIKRVTSLPIAKHGLV